MVAKPRSALFLGCAELFWLSKDSGYGSLFPKMLFHVQPQGGFIYGSENCHTNVNKEPLAMGFQCCLVGLLSKRA